jgi:hypothetical protein
MSNPGVSFERWFALRGRFTISELRKGVELLCFERDSDKTLRMP